MLKKKTILILVIFSILASVVVAGCSDSSIQSQEEEIEVCEASVEYLSFEEVVDQSYCVITAKLNDINNKKDYRELNFTLGQSIIGSMSEKHFTVSEPYANCGVEEIGISYSTAETQYKVGEEYILVLVKISSVYFEDVYQISSDIFIQLDDDGSIVDYQRYHQKEEIEPKDVEDFTNYVRSITGSIKERKVFGVPYTKSTEISDIVDASQYIVKAVVSDIKGRPSTESKTHIYRCKVTETLRGTTDEEILIVLFKDSVTIGKEYLFLCNKGTEHSLIYALSSVNSVMDVQKKKLVVEEIRSLLEK